MRFHRRLRPIPAPLPQLPQAPIRLAAVLLLRLIRSAVLHRLLRLIRSAVLHRLLQPIRLAVLLLALPLPLIRLAVEATRLGTK
jgi:hypothetical protein